MINLFLFVFGVIGLTDIIVESDLFEPIRKILQEKIIPEEAFGIKWHSILKCHQCCGQWCGFFLAPFTLGRLCVIPASNFFIVDFILFVFSFIFNLFLWFVVCGPAGSALASWSFIIKDYILSKTTFDLSELQDEGHRSTE